MILFEGRRAIFKGHDVVIMEVMAYGRVKVCLERNPRMIMIVKRESIERRMPKWLTS